MADVPADDNGVDDCEGDVMDLTVICIHISAFIMVGFIVWVIKR